MAYTKYCSDHKEKSKTELSMVYGKEIVVDTSDDMFDDDDDASTVYSTIIEPPKKKQAKEVNTLSPDPSCSFNADAHNLDNSFGFFYVLFTNECKSYFTSKNELHSAFEQYNPRTLTSLPR